MKNKYLIPKLQSNLDWRTNQTHNIKLLQTNHEPEPRPDAHATHAAYDTKQNEPSRVLIELQTHDAEDGQDTTQTIPAGQLHGARYRGSRRAADSATSRLVRGFQNGFVFKASKECKGKRQLFRRLE